MKFTIEVKIDLPSEFVNWYLDNQYEIKTPFDIYGREIYSRIHSAFEQMELDLQEISGINKTIETIVIDRS